MKTLTSWFGLVLTAVLYVVFLAVLVVEIRSLVETGPAWSRPGLAVLGLLVMLAGTVVRAAKSSEAALSVSLALAAIGVTILVATFDKTPDLLVLILVLVAGVTLVAAGSTTRAESTESETEAPSEVPV